MSGVLLALILASDALDPFGMIGTDARFDMIAIAEPVRQSDRAVVPAPVIDVYAPSWCQACPAKVRELRTLAGYDFRVHSRAAEYPAWTQTVSGFYPIVSWSDGTRIRYIADFSTAANFERRYQATMKRG